MHLESDCFFFFLFNIESKGNLRGRVSISFKQQSNSEFQLIDCVFNILKNCHFLLQIQLTFILERDQKISTILIKFYVGNKQQILKQLRWRLYGIIDLNMSRYTQMKKTYFTKSQTTLPSPHPRQEFIEIIEMKKQYQSLIKQQLQALEAIQNIQIAANQKQWQNKEWLYAQKSSFQQDIKVIPFVVEQLEQNSKFGALDRQQKPDGEFIKSYEELRIIKMQKHFFRLKNQFEVQKSIRDKARASRYLYRQTIQGKYFNQWKISTSGAVSKLNVLKDNQLVLRQFLKQQNTKIFLKLFAQKNHLTVFAEYRNKTNKSKFLRRLCQFTSTRFTVMSWQKELNKLKKRWCFKQVRYLMQQKKTKDELSSKQKLLLNIYCHRRFNSFFSKCKQLKFARERIKITHNIINQIDVLKLIQKTSNKPANQTLDLQNQSQNQQKLISNQSYSMNIQLLSLILQNFVEEYSQEYNTVLDEQDHRDFLHELKTECIRRLINKRKQQQVFQGLRFQIKRTKLQDFIISTYKYHTIQRLALFKKINTSKRILNNKIKTINFSVFINICERNLSYLRSLRVIQKRSNINKMLKKLAFEDLRSNQKQKKIQDFKKEVSDSWRDHYILKNSFISWRQYQALQSEQSAPFHLNVQQQQITLDFHLGQQKNADQFQQQIQNVCIDNSIVAKQSEILQNRKESEGMIKAKQQLSKIVNEISRGMGPKLPFDCYAKSVDNPSPNKVIIKRLKTEASNKQSQVKLSEQMCSQIEDGIESRVFQVNRFLLKIYFKQFVEELRLQKCQNEVIKNKKISSLQNIIKYFRNTTKEYHQRKSRQQLLLNFVKKSNRIIFLKKFSEIKNVRKCYQTFTENRKTILMKKFLNCLKIRQEINFDVKRQNVYQYLQVNRIISTLNKLKVNFQVKKQHFQSILNIKTRQVRSAMLQMMRFGTIKLNSNKLKSYKKQKYAKVLMVELAQILKIKKVKKMQQLKLDQQNMKQNLNQQFNQNQAPRVIITKSNKQSEHQVQAQTLKSDEKRFNLGEFLDSDIVGEDQLSQSDFDRQNGISPVNTQQKRENQGDSHNSQSNSKHFLNSYLNSPNSHSSSPVKVHSLDNSSNIKSQESAEASFSQNNNEQQNQQQDEYSTQWLTFNLKFNEVKNRVKVYRYRIFFQLFQSKETEYKQEDQKIQGQYLNGQVIEENQARLNEIKSLNLMMMLKRMQFNKFISGIISTEQTRVKKQEYERIVQYNLARLQKKCKKRVWMSLYSQLQSKTNVNLKQKCFTGWKLFSRQKKMLKEYLAMQVEIQNRSISYYPTTIQQKQMFNQLKSL